MLHGPARTSERIGSAGTPYGNVFLIFITHDEEQIDWKSLEKKTHVFTCPLSHLSNTSPTVTLLCRHSTVTQTQVLLCHMSFSVPSIRRTVDVAYRSPSLVRLIRLFGGKIKLEQERFRRALFSLHYIKDPSTYISKNGYIQLLDRSTMPTDISKWQKVCVNR